MNKPKSMLEKLEEDYTRSQKTELGRTINKGHAIGFYNELNENLSNCYEFTNGRFTIRKRCENFIWWDYNQN